MAVPAGSPLANGAATAATSNEEAATAMTATPPTPSVDSSNAVDPTVEFTGNINTDNEIPSREKLKQVENMLVLDRDGRAVPFKNLYTGPNVARRVLIIFIRHFFCGNCQEYLRTVTASITEDSLLQLPIPTFIAVVGCGSPSLIPMYQETTNCPFPIYSDPTKRLYAELGMVRTLNLGSRPDYQRRAMVTGIVQSVVQSLKHLKGGRAFQGGDYQQVGGEFLLEPVNMATPTPSPAVGDGDNENKQIGAGGGHLNGQGLGFEEEKQITWCHRMKNTRDHAEIPELREVLGLDGEGIPGKNNKRWSKALGRRKGTGLSGRTSISLNHTINKVSEDGANSSGRASSEKLMGPGEATK